MTRKRYRIIELGIAITIIDLEKIEEIKENIVVENASIYTGMKIESIFWLSALKKDRSTSWLIIGIDNTKMANILIKEGLVLNDTLHGCIRYNLAYRIKQYFNCYKYSHVLVHYQKNKNCLAYSGLHRTLECFQDKAQKWPLFNGAYTS